MTVLRCTGLEKRYGALTAVDDEALAEITRRDGGVGDVPPELGALVAFAVVIVTLAAWRLRATVLTTGR